MHESMHLVFLQKYEKNLLSKCIDNQGVSEITEALTILLNWELKEFLLLPEYNDKPAIKDLQDELVVLSRKKAPFKEMLERLINLRVK